MSKHRVLGTQSRRGQTAYAQRMRDKGFIVEAARSPAEVASRCHLIVTATASPEPLLQWTDIQPGTHITAIGADSADKQELDPAIIRQADLVVTDSRVQGRSRGELWHAYRGDDAAMGRIVEIGEIVPERSKVERQPSR